MKTILRFLSLAALASPMSASLPAATVDYVMGKATAPVHANLALGGSIATQPGGRVQVSMEKTFFRMGSDSKLTLMKNGGIFLDKGVVLVGSNPGKNRRTVRVSAPGFKFEVKGSVLIACYPGKYVKLTVLEGKVLVSKDSLAGEFEAMRPGQMVIINPSDRQLPEPVYVDLGHLVASSPLLSGPWGPPITGSLITAAVAQQAGDFNLGNLARTPFLLRGASPELTLLSVVSVPIPLPPAPTPAALAPAPAPATTPAPSLAPIPAPTPPSVLQPAELNVYFTAGDSVGMVAQFPHGNPYFFRDGLQVYPGTTFPAPNQSNVLLSLAPGVSPSNGVLIDLEASSPFAYQGPLTLHGEIQFASNVFTGIAPELTYTNNPPGGYVYGGISPISVAPGANLSTPVGVGLEIWSSSSMSIQGAQLQVGSGSQINETLELTATAGGIVIGGGSRLTGDSLSLAAIPELISTINGSGRLLSGPSISIASSALLANDGIYIGLQSEPANIWITNNSTISGNTITIAAGPVGIDVNGNPVTPSVIVSKSKLTAQQNLQIGVAPASPSPTPATITLSNSSQLASMVGNITLLSNGGQVTVSNAKLTALMGTVLIDGVDPTDPTSSTGGVVSLQNATLAAQVIKARGFAAAGADGLIINGGTFQASTLLEFYAESASRLRFQNNVQINAPTAILSAQTVQVDPGGNVSISGQAKVYTDVPNYNTSGFGSIFAVGGLNQSPHASHPSF